MDLTSGYMQVAMDPESCAKTAFVTQDGKYEYLVIRVVQFKVTLTDRLTTPCPSTIDPKDVLCQFSDSCDLGKVLRLLFEFVKNVQNNQF